MHVKSIAEWERMLPFVMLLTYIKLPFVIKIFVLSVCAAVLHRFYCTGFRQANLLKIQGLLKDTSMAFKDYKLLKILIYTLKVYFLNAKLKLFREISIRIS